MGKLFEHYQINESEAVNLFNLGFSSNAAKKRATDRVNLAYDFLKKDLQDQLLADRAKIENSQGWQGITDLYYNVPALCNWKEIHSVVYNNYKSFVIAANGLSQLRGAIKGTEVVKTVKADKLTADRTEHVRETVKAEFDRKNAQVINGLDLAKQFNNRLAVSVTAHLVTNSNGTTFTRHFFFLDGKLTALSVIMAIYQRLLDCE